MLLRVGPQFDGSVGSWRSWKEGSGDPEVEGP